MPLMQTAPRDIPMVDMWDFDRLSQDEILQAYKTLIDNEVIKIVMVRISRMNGRTSVEYFSSLPRDWTLGALQKAKEDYLNKSRPVEQKSFL